jgi:iron complex outermembrane receptor protein
VAKNSMLYGTYTKGYKGPAYNVFFNQTALQVGALLPETSESYELGLKSLFFKNRLQMTATAFDTKYKNYQANFQTYVLGTAVTNLINAGQVSTKGIEVDMRALLTSNFTLSASAARINARVDHFYTPAGATNVDGQPLPFSPTFKANVQGVYTVRLANSNKLEFESDYTYQTKEQFSLTETPDTVQPAYGIWNASVAFATPANGWKLTGFVKNITDRYYALVIAQGTNARWRNVPRDNSRYFGVALRKDF